MHKVRNALLNVIWGLGYLAMGEKALGVGLLIALPLFHWPLITGNWQLYLTYPFSLVIVGHLVLTTAFVLDAYIRTDN